MITVDNDLRIINIPCDVELLGVAGDKEVNQLEIEIPVGYRNIDLSFYDVKIKYRNIERGGLKCIEGTYVPTDKMVTEELINFSWVIGEDACRYPGTTEFSICLSNDEGKVFNTRWASLPVRKKQLPCRGLLKDSEVLELDGKNLETSVEDEVLIIKRKEEKSEND